jgi:hypothetical protein
MLRNWGQGNNGQTVNWGSFPGNLLPPGFSLTRASANATYFDSAGLLQTAGANVARGTYRYNGSAWVFDGTIDEAAATNVCVRSNAFTTAPWIAVGTPAGTQNLTGPDGTTSGWTVTDDSVVATEQYQFADVLTAATYTDSVFIKKTTGAQTGYPVMAVNNLTLLAACTVDTTNGVATIWTAYTGFTIATSSCRIEDCGDWWRVSLTYLADAEAGGWQKYVLPAGASTANKSTGTLDAAAVASHGFFGFQRELGSSPTSYVATGAASATRAADVVTATTSGLLVNAQGFVAMKWRAIDNGISAFGSGAIISTFSGVPDGIPLDITGGALSLYDGTAFRSGNALSVSPGSVYSAASTWGGATCQLALDGTPSSVLTFDGSMNFASTVRIGNNVATVSQPVSMVLQSMRLGVVSASSSKLAAMTS